MLMTVNLGGKILGEFLILDTWIFVRTTFLRLKTSCDIFTVIKKENSKNMGVIFSRIMESSSEEEEYIFSLR